MAARLGLEKLVAFCASSVEGRPDHDVAVMDTGSLAKRDTRRHSRSTSPDRFRKPMITSAASGSTGRRGVSSASYARGALLALHLSQRWPGHGAVSEGQCSGTTPARRRARTAVASPRKCGSTGPVKVRRVDKNDAMRAADVERAITAATALSSELGLCECPASLSRPRLPLGGGDEDASAEQGRANPVWLRRRAQREPGDRALRRPRQRMRRR